MTRDNTATDTPIQNPFVQGFELANMMAQRYMERLHELHSDMLAFESESHQRARKARQELTDLMAQSWAHMSELADHWREATLSFARKSTEMYAGK